MTIFTDKAPGIMRKLMLDFGLTVEEAAAILGNLGHESAGFAKLQEIKPVVPGSRGGYGWAQWTGPRRRAYEAYCRRNDLDPASDKANYAYLFVELKGYEGSEAGAIAKLKAASGLRGKVEAFERAFLRAGVKHYDSRELWAKRALEAYREAPEQPVEPPSPGIPPPFGPPSERLPEPVKPQWGKGGIIGLLAVVAAAIAAGIWKLVGG